jgi:hypothetical protein
MSHTVKLEPDYGLAYGPGFHPRHGWDIFLSSITSKPGLGSTQPRIQLLPQALSQE